MFFHKDGTARHSQSSGQRSDWMPNALWDLWFWCLHQVNWHSELSVYHASAQNLLDLPPLATCRRLSPFASVVQESHHNFRSSMTVPNGNGARERSRSRGEQGESLVPIIDIGALSTNDKAAQKAVAQKIGKACEEFLRSGESWDPFWCDWCCLESNFGFLRPPVGREKEICQWGWGQEPIRTLSSMGLSRFERSLFIAKVGWDFCHSPCVWERIREFRFQWALRPRKW